MLADLGNAQLANPEDRLWQKLGDMTVGLCTPEYCSPDVLLGNPSFGPDLDMWSLGCVAAELFRRDVLFKVTPDSRSPSEPAFLEAHFAFLGFPERKQMEWLKSLPFFQEFYGSNHEQLPRPRSAMWPIHKRLGWQSCPPALGNLTQKTLRWCPQDRLPATEAKFHPFVSSPALSVTLPMAKGKNGMGSVASGCLDEEVLDYLQKDPSWQELYAVCQKENFAPNACMSQDEGKRRLKREFVGYTDPDHPPQCMRLNSDSNLKPILSKRLVQFVKALRRCARPWLRELTERVRAAMHQVRMPAERMPNGLLFTEEDFEDNAFAYASIQVLKVAMREDAWHTDGGASLLHVGCTIFGTRELQVEVSGREDSIKLTQSPGSFYIGNMCALRHNVVHGAHAPGSCGAGLPSEQFQIAVMLRSDVFRECRARKINATPGPTELYDLVNLETARMIVERPFYLPDLPAILAETVPEGSLLSGKHRRGWEELVE